MTLSYNVGLTGGALAAYLLERLLGPAKLKPCKLLHSVEKLVDFKNVSSKSIIRAVTTLSTTAVVHMTTEMTTVLPTTTVAYVLLNSTSVPLDHTIFDNEVPPH